MSTTNGFTPTEKAMLELLSDGRPHLAVDLHKCCGPSSLSTVKVHIAAVRKKLAPRGEDIVCVATGGKHKYQHVRKLVNPYDGVH